MLVVRTVKNFHTSALDLITTVALLHLRFVAVQIIAPGAQTQTITLPVLIVTDPVAMTTGITGTKGDTRTIFKKKVTLGLKIIIIPLLPTPSSTPDPTTTSPETTSQGHGLNSLNKSCTNMDS